MNGIFASVQAGRWRLVLDDLATTGVSLRQPGE
jgi:orotate phosphoribosyltransferase